MRALEPIEEWLTNQVGALRKTLSKAILGAWTAAVPLLLLWSGLSTANKIAGSILWVSVTLNLFLLALVCRHRTQKRLSEVDQAKKLRHVEHEGFSEPSSDTSMILRIVAAAARQGHTTKGKIRNALPDMGDNDFELFFHRSERRGYLREGGNPEFNAPHFVEILPGGREFIKRSERAEQREGGNAWPATS